MPPKSKRRRRTNARRSGAKNEPLKVRVWAVLGAGGVGKSTILGNLAYGVRVTKGNALCSILLRGGGTLLVYVMPSACQEMPCTPQEVVDLVEDAARQLRDGDPNITLGSFNVLLAPRYKPRGTKGTNWRNPEKYPAGHAYLSYFIKKGWTIESLVLLRPINSDAPPYLGFGAPSCFINAPKLSANLKRPDLNRRNLMIAVARNHFGWA